MIINLKLKKCLFNQSYYPLLRDYSHRYEVYYGGAGSGKSYFVFQKMVVKAITSERTVLIVRKTAKSNANSTYQLLLDTLSKFKLLPYCTINKSTQRIELPNGSLFIFSGLDDVEKLKSIVNVTDIVAEECSELNEEDVTQLDLRLRALKPNLQMFFMFNPVSKANWTYKKWFGADKKLTDETTIMHSTYKDNKFLSQEYINAIEEMKNTNYNFYKIYALGEFASLDKLVFQNWEVKQFNHETIKGDLLLGIDFGFVNDTTAVIASVLCEEEKAIYIFAEWGNTGNTNDELAAQIIKMGLHKSVIIADSAEPKSIEEIKRLGVSKMKPAKKGAGSIISGIQKLQAYRIYVLPSCPKVIEELQNYSWLKDKKTNEYINKPIDDFNHFLDALRYSLQCSKNKLRTISKDTF